MGSRGCLGGTPGEGTGLAGHPGRKRAGEQRTGMSRFRRHGPSGTRKKEAGAGAAAGTFLPISSFPAVDTQSFCSTETKAKMCTLNVNKRAPQIN